MRMMNDSEKCSYSNVWVIAEAQGGVVAPVTYELIGAARRLADQRGSQVTAVLLGSGTAEAAPGLIPYGADQVIVADDTRLAGFCDEAEARILDRLIRRHKPEIILCGATVRGRALAPRVAVMSFCGLTADCTGLDIDPETGDLLQTRPAFGGNVMATIRCANHRPQMATVRPRVMKAPEPDPAREGTVSIEEVTESDIGHCKRVIETVHDAQAVANLADARIIVAGGRAMKGREGFRLLERLANQLGGAVGASRAAVDAGWVSYAHQVGQTGQTVQTKVYIACGISGQIQHLVGMQSCDLIIAIDKNPDTPMMQMADIAIEGDLFEIVPILIESIADI